MSFLKYMESRSLVSPTGSLLSEYLPIGGFVPGEKYPITEAKDDVTLISKTPIVFGEDDIKFIMQFPPNKWAEALSWRYGQGLKWASEELEDSGEIPEETDISFTHRSGDMTFQAKTHNLKELFEKLTKSRDDGGLYGFMLHDWKHIEADDEDKNNDIKDVNNLTPNVQLRARNYGALTIGTSRNIMYRWRNGVINGFLGKSNNVHWISPDQEEGQKKTGAPPRKILVTWDGKIINQRGGEIIPVFGPEQASKFMDSDTLRASESGKPAMGIYKFKSGDRKLELSSTIPALHSGKIFERKALSDFDDHQEELRKLLFDAIAGTPLEKQAIIDPKELPHYINHVKAQEIMGLVGKAMNFLPDSGDEQAAKTVTPEVFSARKTSGEKGSRGIEIVSKGGFEPAKHSQQQEPITAKMLKDLGTSRKKYEDIVKKHFVSAGSHNVDVVGPSNNLVSSPIWDGINNGAEGESKRTPTVHAQLLAEEIPTMFEYAKILFMKNIGLTVIQKFVSLVLQKNVDQDEFANGWKDVAYYARNKANMYVREVSQLNLGVGTRAERRKGLKIDDFGDIADDKIEGGTQAVDPKTGERTGVTRSFLDAERGVGKKILRPRSTLGFMGSHSDNLWKIASELEKLKKLQLQDIDNPDSVDEHESKSNIRDEMNLRGRMINLYTDQISKENPTMDRLQARKKAVQKTREEFKSKGFISSNAPIGDVVEDRPVVPAKHIAQHIDLFNLNQLEKLTPNQRDEQFASPAFHQYLMSTRGALETVKKASLSLKSRALFAAIAKAESEMKPINLPHEDEDDLDQYRRSGKTGS